MKFKKPESELTQREKDIAASLQKITNEIVLKIVDHARKIYPSKNLRLAVTSDYSVAWDLWIVVCI
jgi:carbamoyltransferase